MKNKHFISSIMKNQYVLPIIVLLFSLFIVVQNFNILLSNVYLDSSDFINNSGDNFNSYSLLVPFYLNLFSLGTPSDDLLYYGSNQLILIITFSFFSLTIISELIGIKNKSYLLKIIFLNSYFTYSIIERIFVLVKKGVFFDENTAFLIVFSIVLFAYSFFCITNFKNMLYNKAPLARDDFFLLTIKKTIFVLAIIFSIATLSLITNFVFLDKNIFSQWNEPPVLYGFSLTLQELNNLSLFDRFPSLLLYLFLGMASCLVMLAIMKKKNLRLYGMTLMSQSGEKQL